MTKWQGDKVSLFHFVTLFSFMVHRESLVMKGAHQPGVVTQCFDPLTVQADSSIIQPISYFVSRISYLLSPMTNSYLDFDLEIGRNNDGIYSVQARWQGNEAYHEATLPSDSDPTRLRKEIEEAVLDSPLRRRRAFSSNEETVRYWGQRLFDFALSGEVLAQLRACQRAAKSQSHEGVRLRLRILDPELAGLPWEYLYDSRLRDFIALDPTLPIVRYLHHPQAVPPL